LPPETPEKIIKEYHRSGYSAWHAVPDEPYGLPPCTSRKKLIRKVTEAHELLSIMLSLAKDCSLAEINPLVVTQEDDVIALDAKLNFDDSALFRHPDIVELRDKTEEDPKELWAAANEGAQRM
jgi:succinyl-CoA synthetase beta subunit